MGINPFSDLTMSQFEDLYGMKEEHHKRHFEGHKMLQGGKSKARKERYDAGEREMQRREGFDANDYEWLDNSTKKCITANWLEMGKVG